MMLIGSNFGTTIAVRTLGLLMIAGGWLKPSRPGEGAALIGTSLIVVSFAFMGHTAAAAQRWLLAPLLIAHLFTVAFWFGSLWPLATVTRCENAVIAGAIIESFSKVAIWAVSVIFVAGVAMAGALLPGLASLRSPYGISLMGKLAGFAILMALASMNKWRLGPKIAQGNRSSLKSLQLSVLAEWVLILTVVTITAAMTALFSPDH